MSKNKSKLSRIPSMAANGEFLHLSHNVAYVDKDEILLGHEIEDRKDLSIPVDVFIDEVLINVLEVDIDYLLKHSQEDMAIIYVDEYGNMDCIDPVKNIDYKEDGLVIENGFINMITKKPNKYEISMYDNCDLYIVNVESIDYEIVLRLGRKKLIKKR